MDLYGQVGILILVVVSYLLAIVFYNKGQIRVSLLFILLSGLGLRVLTSSDLYLHDWDERFHALVAKHLSEHPLKPTLYETPPLPYDYKEWYQNNVWLHKQPLPLWGIAVSLYLFGNNEFAVRIPSIILSVLSILLTYKIIKFYLNERVALLSAFLQSINGFIIELCAGRVATDHVDTFFLFFTELAILFVVLYANKKSMWYLMGIGFSIGLAVLCKWLTAYFVLLVWLMTVYNKTPIRIILGGLGIILVSSLVVFLPWQIFILSAYPQEALWEYHFNSMHMFQTVEGKEGGILYYISKARITWNELVYLLFIWFVYSNIRLRNTNRWVILVWVLIIYGFFTIASTKMPAYVLPAAPAIFAIISDAVLEIYTVLKLKKYTFFAYAFLIITIGLSIRYSIERIKPFKTDNNAIATADYARHIDQYVNPVKSVIFNCKKNIEVMFYSDVIAYAYIPSQKQINELKIQGWHVYIIDHDLPPDIYDQEIHVLHLPL